MANISKIEQFRQTKLSIKKNKKYLLIGIDVSKKSSVACFYNIEKDILLRKYSITHGHEGFQQFHQKIEQIMKTNNLQTAIIGVEPTGNYHKPLSEFLKARNYQVVYVSSVAANSNRKTIDAGRWGKNDPRDAYNIVDLMRQGKIHFCRDEQSPSMDIRKYLMLRQRLMKTKTSLKIRIQNNIWACCFPELSTIFTETEDPDVFLMLEHCPSSDQVRAMDFTSFMNLFPESRNRQTKRHTRLIQTWESAKTSVGFPISPATVLESKIIARDLQRTQQDIDHLDHILARYSRENDSFRNLLTIPGYGVFTAAVFSSIIGNIADFSHSRQLVKLAGLDIETMSSGSFKGKEHISKKGNSLLRYALCHAAHIAVSKHKIIKQLFLDQLKERGNSKEAKAKLKIKFTEKFLRAAFVMLKNNVPFNINLFTVPVNDPDLNHIRA